MRKFSPVSVTLHRGDLIDGTESLRLQITAVSPVITAAAAQRLFATVHPAWDRSSSGVARSAARAHGVPRQVAAAQLGARRQVAGRHVEAVAQREPAPGPPPQEGVHPRPVGEHQAREGHLPHRHRGGLGRLEGPRPLHRRVRQRPVQGQQRRTKAPRSGSPSSRRKGPRVAVQGQPSGPGGRSRPAASARRRSAPPRTRGRSAAGTPPPEVLEGGLQPAPGVGLVVASSAHRTSPSVATSRARCGHDSLRRPPRSSTSDIVAGPE